MDRKQYNIYHENKNHTPSDFPYNTYVCSIPMDFQSVKLHWHDEIELIVIKKGEGIVSVDLTPYCVKSGDIVFIFSGQLHSIEQKEDAVMEYENILFKPALLKSSGHDYCNDNFIQPLFTGKLRLTPLIRQPELKTLIEEIDILCDIKSYGYQLSVKGLLYQMMFHLIRGCAPTAAGEAGRKNLEKLKTALAYISEHYRNPISIEEIAGVCYYSKSYFMKFFKEATGMGFIQYLNDYRLDIAASLLLETDDNIIDIAACTGFDNLSYFNRSFKRKYGVTPGRYRVR